MKNLICKFSIVAVMMVSCGQNNQVVSNDSVASNNQTQATVIIPKLPRTLTTDEFTNIYCGMCDRSGNLWFGSSGEGLYRFDGTTFTQFTIKDGLTTNDVHSLLEDQAGNIWIGTGDGICKYDGRSISKFPIVVADPSVLINPDKRYKNEIWSLMQDKSGKIWIGASVGMFTYDGSKFSQFPKDYSVTNTDKLELKMVDDILEDKEGNIWFASGMPPGGEGVVLFDGKSLTKQESNGDVWVRSMLEDQSGNIWFNGRHNGIFRYDPDALVGTGGKSFAPFTEKKSIGSAMVQDYSGNIWFTGEENDNGYSSVDGVWRYDGTTFTNFTTKDGMGDYGVWCIVEDLKGNIWFGTRNNGLYRYDGKSFTCYSE